MRGSNFIGMIAIGFALAGPGSMMGVAHASSTAMTPPQAVTDPNYGFTIELAFTANALQGLTERNEQVIVSASYYADPSEEGAAHADEIGRIDLGTKNVQVRAEPGTVHVAGSQVDPEGLRWIDGDIGVNVNVYTARLSSDDNLINCDFIDGPLVDTKAAEPVLLRCALITENMDSELRP